MTPGDLQGIPDASIDISTTRSVLIYVVDKAEAFAAFARVLRPDGRLSLFECHIDVERGSHSDLVSFDALLGSAPNPNAPTPREAMTAALTEPEHERFPTELRSAFDGGGRGAGWPSRT